MNNRLWLLVGGILHICGVVQADQSHSYFVPRQVTTNSVFELGLNNYDWYHRRQIEDVDRSYSFSAYATPFFQQSTRAKKISKYFLRCNSECLTFNEINHDTYAIESLWFGAMSDLDTNLSSQFSMRPCHRAYGSYFNFSLAKERGRSALWCNLSFAAMKMEHTLRMCESKNEEDGPLSNFDLGTISSSDSIIAALNNSEWNNGRFCPGTLKKSGVDDIQLKFGYDHYFNEGKGYANHVSPYLVTTIPTGERQRSLFVFEPIVGSKNWSAGVGLNADYTFYDNDRDSLTWLVDVTYRYVFGKDQCRTFDLCANGDWSRYLLVVPSDQTADTIYGVNFFTINAHVTPKSTIDFWTALHWERGNWNVEFGYDFWWRQKESISCKSSLDADHGIFDIARANTAPLTASTANISQGPLSPNQAQSDSTFVKIQNSDLNLDSAAHPAALSSTIYVAADYAFDTQYPTMLGLGMQYEFAHRISALEQWGIWAKAGVIF